VKILVAYDGSSYADAAIDDLQWAGLLQDADAIVLSVVEWPLQSPRSWGMVETGFPAELEAEIKAAERLAEKGRDRLQEHFPKWKSQAISSPAGHASTAILDKASDWSADLIVAGTHGRSGLARVVLGSVSLKLVREATCSVRIARARQPGLPIRLVIGDDGSPEAEEAVAEVARRTWPAGTRCGGASISPTGGDCKCPHGSRALRQNQRRRTFSAEGCDSAGLRSNWLIQA
jgi:nucleotide-binding universal stress UspA family protein